MFEDYVRMKHYNKREFYITRKQYCNIDFLNEVPEVICDLLFYLTGYMHHKTDLISEEAYNKLLTC